MKNLTIMFSLLFCHYAFTQIVDIPDANFKNALIEQGVDINGDGEIQESEALQVDSLYLYSKKISTLQGIKSFKNLIHLNCSHNQLNNLDLYGLNLLQQLNCGSNQLTNLDLKGNQNLLNLDCDYNKLTDLDLQGLTNLKTIRILFNTLKSINLEGLIVLESLLVNDNQLTTLNVNHLTNLQALQCGNNQITNLNIKELYNLADLRCYNNNLTSIDISGMTKIFLLLCQNNQLLSLNIKNNSKILNWGNLDFYGNPNLKYICCDDFEIADIKEKVMTKQYGLYNCVFNTYCSFTPGGIFYTIKGENKLDTENKGCDIGDLLIPNFKFNITNGLDSGSFLAGPSGLYTIPVQSGMHTLTPLLENPSYFSINPTSTQATFPDAGDTLVQNFCVIPNGIHHDVQISIIPTTTARPGFDAKYKIIYKNKGNQTESGNINFLFDDAILDFVSSDTSPDAQSTDLLSWNFADLKPFESRTINIVLNVNSPMETPPVNLGDILTYEANISIPDFDEEPLDNVFDLRQTVVNSVDPNDKTCLEGNTIKPSMVGEYVHYLIRFENTGTYAAENVVVKDVIDASVFDVQSLQIIDASHKMFTRVNNNVVEFIFEDIQLPFDDANNDGYVAFEIKTRPNLKIGDVLKNKAEIYFDYNLPIITNEAQTLVKNAVRTTEAKELAIDFYPNPAKDQVKFLINDQIEKAQVYDLNGKILRSTSVSNNELNIQELQSGTYMVRLYTKNNVYIAKVVKM